MAYQDSSEIDQIFEDLRRGLMGGPGGFGAGFGGMPLLGAGPGVGVGWGAPRMPMVDVLDEGDRFVVAVELPGVRKEDIRLNVHDNVVRIHAERTESVEAPGEGGVGERAERGLRGQGSGRAAGRAGGASVEPRGGEGRGGYVRRERIQMAFDRTIRLPEEIRDDQVTARFTNGVLTLVLPKADPQGGGGNIRIE